MSDMKSSSSFYHESTPQTLAGLPAKQGLYDPRYEHDACGRSPNYVSYAEAPAVSHGIDDPV